MLLTSEPIDSEQSAQLVMDKYEKRWQVEEYHKAWKSGTKVEELRQQRGENLKKMAVLLGFIAVRLLHLKMQMETAPEQPCSEVLSKDQWQVLWLSIEKTPLPAAVPSSLWAYRAIAKFAH